MLTTQLDPEPLSGLPPGTHIVLLSDCPLDGIQGRRFGLELRDTLLILTPLGNRFAFLFRKAVEGTVAENTLRYGCGGLNIDACRVQSDGGHFRSTVTGRSGGMVIASDTREGAALGMYQPGKGFEPTNSPLGRWPSNLVLVHHAECREVGTRKVRGTTPMGPNPGKRRGVGFQHAGIGAASDHADPDGLETLVNWECHESCPVRALDEQSGQLTSGRVEPHHMKNSSKQPSAGGFEGGFKDFPLTGFGDAGGASRFFPQFKDDAELHGWLRTLIGDAPAQDTDA